MTNSWWHRPIRMYQTNLREIDSGLDVGRVLDRMEYLGANTWLLNVAGIVSHYPSSLPFQLPSPWLKERPSGDLVGDAIEEAHGRSIRVVARCDFSKVQARFAEEHPDWCFRHPDGSPQVYNGLYSVCPSGEYYQRAMFEVLDEVLATYEIDGFFFNQFNFGQRDYSGRAHGVCQCDNCKRGFSAMYGEDLPEAVDPEDDRYLHWLEYVRLTLNDISDRVRKHIKERKPNACLFLRVGSDVAFREVNNAVDRPQPLWTTWAGEVAREVRAPAHPQPVLVHCVMFLDIPYRFTPEQGGLVSFELMQAMSNGAHLSAYVMGVGDELGSSTMPLVRDIFQFHRAHESIYGSLQSNARIGLVRSEVSEEWYGRADGEARVRNEYRGLYELLAEGHLPFDIISDTELEAFAAAGQLDRYECLVLPNVAAMTDALGAVLDSYVEHGGALVATYESGLYTPLGRAREEGALRCLGLERTLARRTDVAEARSSYLMVDEGDQKLGSLEPGRMVPVDEGFLHVRARSGACSRMMLIPPSPYGPPEKCYWDITTTHPGLVLMDFGRGRTAYIPWGIGALYHRLNLNEYRQVFLGAVEAVLRKGRQVLTDAPAHVEVVVGRTGPEGSDVVHLLNYSGQRGRAFHDAIEMRDLRVGLRDASDVTSVAAHMLEAELPVEHEDGRAWVTLPQLRLFEVLSFRRS